jgi:hypothetical protein
MVKYTEMAPDRFKDFWRGPLFGQSATASDAGRPYLAATRAPPLTIAQSRLNLLSARRD